MRAVTLAVVELCARQYSDSVKNVQAVKLYLRTGRWQALRGLPGVQQVAVTSTVPLSGENWVDELIRPGSPAAGSPTVAHRRALDQPRVHDRDADPPA